MNPFLYPIALIQAIYEMIKFYRLLQEAIGL